MSAPEAPGPPDPSIPTGAPAPGWYPDPFGFIRWWDGRQWGVYAPGQAPAQQAPAMNNTVPNNTVPVLAHLSVLIGGIILAAVLYAVADKNDPWQRWHVTEALNFQLSVTLVSFAGMVLGFVLAIVTLGLGLFLILPLLVAVSIGAIVYGVLAAMATSRGEWYRYPITFRFLKG